MPLGVGDSTTPLSFFLFFFFFLCIFLFEGKRVRSGLKNAWGPDSVHDCIKKNKNSRVKIREKKRDLIIIIIFSLTKLKIKKLF
jgi:hypothetical protein